MILLAPHRWRDRIGPSVESLTEIEQLPLEREVLIGFCTGVIVPPAILHRVARAYNFHAASPAYPGRDPHHWATYDLVGIYGATCHVMTEQVDAGPIIDVRWFPVFPQMTPQDLRLYAEEAAVMLYHKLLPRLLDGTATPHPRYQWSGTKHTRADLQRLGTLTSDMPVQEVRRRLWAVQASGHRNTILQCHNLTWHLDTDEATAYWELTNAQHDP